LESGGARGWLRGAGLRVRLSAALRHCEFRTGLRPVPLDETGGGRLSESGRILGLSV
jgi:hypothetical protein